jgi:hypothetical protein
MKTFSSILLVNLAHHTPQTNKNMIAPTFPVVAALLLFAISLGALLPAAHAQSDPDWPNELGPFVLKQYPAYTLAPNPLTGQVWVRINGDLNKIQFMYQMDQDPTATPYYPFFAMHLHYGEVKAGNKGGPIVVTIRGKGDLTGYTSPSSPISGSVCSSSCLPGALGCDPNCPSNNTFPYTFAYAYSCDGGCDGDERDGDNRTGTFKSLAPSRFCDLDNSNPSLPPQGEWMDGRYSDERSGNSADDGYSPYSIFKNGNFPKFCSYEIDFLPTLFVEGVYTYVALHSNYNATGAPDLLYGTLLAIVNNGTGIQLVSTGSAAGLSPLSSLVLLATTLFACLLGLLGL